MTSPPPGSSCRPSLPSTVHELFRASVLDLDGGLVLRVRPPVRPGQRRRPTAGLARPPEDAVYFESFYGRTAGDNPLGIDRALARMYPEVRRYWSVVDGSVAIPDGAVRLIEGSAEWWRVRAAARVLVVNDWLRWPYRRRSHQHVLQTWHGTMLKRLALDRPDVTAAQAAGDHPRATSVGRVARAERLQCEDLPVGVRSAGTDLADRLSAQRRACRRGPRRAVSALRSACPSDARLVLYAPTWRDDRDEIVDDARCRRLRGSAAAPITFCWSAATRARSVTAVICVASGSSM